MAILHNKKLLAAVIIVLVSTSFASQSNINNKECHVDHVTWWDWMFGEHRSQMHYYTLLELLNRKDNIG